MHVRARLTLTLLAGLLVLAGCGSRDVPETSLEVPSIVEPVPEAPTPADEGAPGNWEALPGLDEPARAFLVEPGAAGGRGLLLVHGSWGINDRFRELARRFSDAGFLVVAPDLFEGVHATTRLAHEPLVQGVEPGRAAELILAAERRLNEAGYAPESRGAVGVGVGGTWLLLGVGEGLDTRPLLLDTAFLAADSLPANLDGSEPILFYGNRHSSFTADRLAEMARLVAERGGTLETRIVEGAGTTLLDERAMGFSGLAYEEVLEQMIELLRENLTARGD